MTKKARWDGPHPVRVTWPPGEPYNIEYQAIVEPNHQLPADAPKGLRDDLLQRDDWTEIEGKSDDQKDGER